MAFNLFGNTQEFTASASEANSDNTIKLVKQLQDKNGNQVYQLAPNDYASNGNKYIWCKPISVSASYSDAAISSVKYYRTGSNLLGITPSNSNEITPSSTEFFYGDTILARYYVKDGYRLDGSTTYIDKTFTLSKDNIININTTNPTFAITTPTFETRQVRLTIRLDKANGLNMTGVTSTTGITTIAENVTIPAGSSESGKEERHYTYWLTVGSGGTANYKVTGSTKTGYELAESNNYIFNWGNTGFNISAPRTAYYFTRLKSFQVGITCGKWWSYNTSNLVIPYNNNSANFGGMYFTKFPSVRIYVKRNETAYPKTDFEDNDSSTHWTYKTTDFPSSPTSSNPSSGNYTQVTAAGVKKCYYGDRVYCYNRSDSIRNDLNYDYTYQSVVVTSNKTMVLDVESRTVSVGGTQSSDRILSLAHNNVSYGSNGIINLASSIAVSGYSKSRIKKIIATDNIEYNIDMEGNGNGYYGSDVTNLYHNTVSTSQAFGGDGNITTTSTPVAFLLNPPRVVLTLDSNQFSRWGTAANGNAILLHGLQSFSDEDMGGEYETTDYYIDFKGTADNPQLRVWADWVDDQGTSRYTGTYYGSQTISCDPSFKWSLEITYYGYNPASTSTAYYGTMTWIDTPTLTTFEFSQADSSNSVYALINISNASYFSMNGNQVFKVTSNRVSMHTTTGINHNIYYTDTGNYSQETFNFYGYICYPGIPEMYYDEDWFMAQHTPTTT